MESDKASQRVKKEYISRANLLKRDNWSQPAIRRLLEKPDKEVELDNGKMGVLFLLNRVKAIETSGRLEKFNSRRAENLAKS